MIDITKSIGVTKEQLIKQAGAINLANKLVSVSGERITLHLEERDIPIVYYRCGKENAPLLIGFHSGGFIFGGCALDDSFWPQLCDSLGVDVASVGYRKSPDHGWKDSLADAYDSCIYILNHSSEFGFDRNTVYIAGQSAGGNLAAAVCLKAGQSGEINFKKQLLFYPLLDLSTSSAEKGTGSFANETCDLMNEMHADPADCKDPYCSPIFADDEMLSKVPDAVFVLCGDDNLKAEGIRYCNRLVKMGKNAVYRVFDKMPHGFFEMGFKPRYTPFDYNFLGKHGQELQESGQLRDNAKQAIEFVKNNL